MEEARQLAALNAGGKVQELQRAVTMNSYQRFRVRLVRASIGLLAGLSLTACGYVNLEDFNETSPYGVLVIGSAFDTGDFPVSINYEADFRAINRQPASEGWQLQVHKGAFTVVWDLDMETSLSLSFAGIGAYRAELAKVNYYVFKLEPAEYYLYEARQFDDLSRSITCFKPPTPGFTIEAGQTVYVGNLIFESGQAKSYSGTRIGPRDDDSARAAIAAKGGDPSKMQWQAFRNVDFKYKECQAPFR